MVIGDAVKEVLENSHEALVITADPKADPNVAIFTKFESEGSLLVPALHQLLQSLLDTYAEGRSESQARSHTETDHCESAPERAGCCCPSTA